MKPRRPVASDMARPPVSADMARPPVAAIWKRRAKAQEAATCDSERLYVQDVIRESQYLALRKRVEQESSELFAGFPPADLRRKPDELRTSIRAWTHARLMADLDTAYGEGRYEDAARLLGEIAKLGSENDAPE